MKLLNEIEDAFIELKGLIQDRHAQGCNLAKNLGIGADGEVTTYIDDFSERFLIDRFGRYEMLTEEKGRIGNSDIVLIIDPIDGTTNAKRNFGWFSVAIAIYSKTENAVIGGFVGDLRTGDVYKAQKHKGSYLNGNRICVSKTTLNKSFVGVSRPIYDADFSLFRKIVQAGSSARMIGCPSLEICSVASGKLDWSCQIHTKPHATVMDVAAAGIILNEAGGLILNERMGKIPLSLNLMNRFNFIAFSPSLKKELKKIFLC